MVQSQIKTYEEISLHQDCQYLPCHAFSIEYWNDIDYMAYEEKENKIQKFVNTCLNEFKDEMGDETKQSFSSQGDFTQYLLSMKDESHFSTLMKECAQHYALLSKSKSHAIKARLLVQFPPKAEDLACIPGTRTRLQSATQELKGSEGLLDPLDEMIQQGIQRQLNKILIDHKLSYHVYPGNEIHLQPYFHHVLGVSEKTVKEKDQFFSLPQSEITAESVHDFLSTLETTVSKTIIDILKKKLMNFLMNSLI